MKYKVLTRCTHCFEEREIIHDSKALAKTAKYYPQDHELVKNSLYYHQDDCKTCGSCESLILLVQEKKVTKAELKHELDAVERELRKMEMLYLLKTFYGKNQPSDNLRRYRHYLRKNIRKLEIKA